MIITIDGPAGAGKSTTAQKLAERLGFEVLDTGAMYRAVGLAASRAGVRLDDAASLEALLAPLRLDMLPKRVLLNGEDVSLLLRTPEVDAASSVVAVQAVVRRRLVELQRAAAVGRHLVCEGRDQGTVVFPDAACKFFLIAEPLERARRRQRELAARGQTVELAELLRAIEERDRRDAARDLAPMAAAADAILLDSTAFTVDEMVNRMETEVRAPLVGRLRAGELGMPDWLWYEFCYWMTWAGATLAWSLRFEGARHVPPKGPALLVANHQSFLDPVMIGLAARRHLFFLARSTLFKNPLFGRLLRSVNVVPVDQEGVAKEGMKAILEKLKQGHPVLVFPEGNRSEDGAMQPLKPGVMLLINRSQAPIVPIGIAGAFELYPRHRKLPKLAPLFMPAPSGGVAVSIGPAIAARQFTDLPREQALSALAEKIHTQQQRAERLRRKA